MDAVSWFLVIGMVCYLGSMFYTLVLATFLDDDSPETATTPSTPADHSTDETVINYGSRPTSAGI